MLRPELLLYGAIAAEMHVRGLLPGVGATRSSTQSTLALGMNVTGRDLKTGVMHAFRVTQTCMRALSGAMERTCTLSSVFSSANPPRAPTGVHSACMKNARLLLAV